VRASGNIGSELAAKSPPDGYTWLMINNAQAANVSLFKSLPLRSPARFHAGDAGRFVAAHGRRSTRPCR
jgi:hypothetical protein